MPPKPAIKKPPHRAHGEGSIRKRGRHFEAAVTLGGQRLTATLPTRDEAVRWIREQHAQADAGFQPALARQTTLAAFLADWLAAKAGTLAPKTYQTYEITVRLHIQPTLGALKLSDLRPEHLQALYATRAATPRTALNCHLVLRQALQHAVKLRLLSHNPATAAIPPRYSRPEMSTWTTQQARLFLAAQQPASRWAALYWILLATGVRLGEACGLRWADVDLDAGRLAVRRQIQRVPHAGGLIVGEPKSRAARVIDLLVDDALAALRAWRARQDRERLQAGPAWQPRDYVITTRTGTPLEPRHVLRHFSTEVKRLGLPAIRPHDLRHTCATLLLENGVPMKVVQEVLGHSKISITMDLYAHVTPTMQAQAKAATRAIYGHAE